MKLQRTLAPTAAPLPLWTAVKAVRGLWGRGLVRDRIEAELRKYLGADDILLVSSGKAALTLILQTLARTRSGRRVVIPAYTCFSVPSAVVKAGLEVVPCDIDPRTLDFNYQDLERLLNDRTLCVLSTHLYGASADTARVVGLCHDRGIAVIEDAAQAFGASVGGRKVGSMGDVAFFSLGRGKNVSCGNGGIVVTRSEALARGLREEYGRWLEPSVRERVSTWLEVVLTSIFLHPWLYWFPAGLPFLGLGETKFDTSFALTRLDDVKACLLEGWRERLEHSNRRRTEAAEKLLEEVGEIEEVCALPRYERQYLRFPILLRDAMVKEAVCRAGRDRGLGISPSYPSIVARIPELAGKVPDGPCPGAQEVVDRLVTLPIHQYVDELDRARLLSTIKQCRGAAVVVPQTAPQAGNRDHPIRSCSMV